MLKGKGDDSLAIACAYAAHYENVHFFTFSPQDVDYYSMLIKEKLYEKGQWVEKIVEYPHVIYDRLRLRGVWGYNNIYEELDGIPFTNEFHSNSISKLKVYDQLLSTGRIDNYLIPYKKINRVGDIFHFIEKYNTVIIKLSFGSFAKGVHFISKQQEDDQYFVAEKE